MGDIVPLNHGIDEPVTVTIDSVHCYDAVTGRRGKHLAALIVDVGPEQDGWQ